MDQKTNNSLQKFWTSRRFDIAALSVIAGLFLLSFGRYFLRGKYLIGGDAFFYTLPLRTTAWQIIRSGSLPLWTPSVLSGFPLLAMSQLGLAYPMTWGHLFLPPYVAEQIYVLIPFILAPAFTYAYLREINRSRTAALIAALSFGYGGLMTNTYGMNAIPTNALMWLPLLLIVIERARTKPIMPCLISGSLIASLSLLTGHAASTLQVAVIALAYSIFCSKTFEDKESSGESRRWQPLLVGAGSFLFATGITAFQILETMRAVRRSIRDKLTFEFFVAGGFTPLEFVRSLLVPLNHYTEVTAYQAPLMIGLAIVAIVKLRRSDPRVLFWTVVAVLGAVMMLGENGLLYSLLYQVPVFKLFRRPSRYAFEWTLAISVLAGFGYDAIVKASDTAKRKRNLLIGIPGLVVCLLLAVVWRSKTHHGVSDLDYLSWKLIFTVATATGLFLCWRFSQARILQTAFLLLICFVEPFILISIWWPGTSKPAARFQTPSLTTSWLEQFPPVDGRVYVRSNGADEETRSQPRFDALDRTAMFGLQNTGGYEPLFPERYSRALGGVSFDSIGTRPGFLESEELLGPQSNVLDLLNARYVVRWADPPTKNQQPETINPTGIPYTARDIAKEIKWQESFTLPGSSKEANSLGLVTSLSNSSDLDQGTEVARLQVFTTDNEVINLSLRAGVDTAEWAHERPDIRPSIRHKLAAVFDRTFVDPSYSALRFETRVFLGKSTQVDHIVITSTTQRASIALWKATLFDSNTLASTPLTNRLGSSELDASRWQLARQFDGVDVLKNKRALPRVWLTHAAQAVDGEAALKAIQGLGPQSFDPKKTVLLEVNQNELPELPASADVTSDEARVVNYEPNRIVIETHSETASVLVVSEMFYPGWKATLDGQPVRILLADYLLRAISLPPGKHQVVMRYTAPAARNGAIIGIATLGLLCLLFLDSRRQGSMARRAGELLYASTYRVVTHVRDILSIRRQVPFVANDKTKVTKIFGKFDRADVLALASILIFFIAFFGQSIFGNSYLMAGDSLFYTYPLRTIAWQMIRSGQFPLWTPGILSGYPLLSMAQLGLAYPLTWGYLFLPAYLAEKIYVLAPFLLSPMFTYAYLRSLDRSVHASLLGALAFGYGGMMASPISNNGLTPHAFTWLPLLLLIIERSRRWRFAPTLVAATIVYSLSVLTGFAQSFITVGVLVAAYAGWLALFDRSTNDGGFSRWKPLIVTAGAGILSLGVAAFQIFETARVVRRSVRRTLNYEVFTQGSFEPTNLLLSFTTPIFHVIDMQASVVPIAVVLGVVAVVAHLVGRNVQRDMRVFFWLSVAVVSIVLMMGAFTPLYRIVYYIPVLNLFRVPSRHTSEWTFAAGVLGAYGWDALAPTFRRLRAAKDHSQLTTLHAALIMIGIGLVVGYVWWIKAQTLQVTSDSAYSVYSSYKVGMAALLALAIWRASLVQDERWRTGLITLAIMVSCFVEPSLLLRRWWGTLGRPVSAAQQPTTTTRYLQQFPASGNRVYTRVVLMSEQEGNPLRLDATNLSAMWGLQDVAGYEPLELKRYSEALGGTWLDGIHPFGGQPDPSLFSADSHVLDILNTTHVVSYKGLATSLPNSMGPPAPHSEFWSPVYEENNVVVMRNSRALPRAWLVGEAEAVKMEVALDRIRGNSKIDFDPRRTALLEVNPSELPALPGGLLPEGSEAKLVSYEPTRLTIETKSTQPSVLVVSEMFFPGWEAWIDGKWTRIQIANYLLRAVFLPAGEHKVEMRYTAPAFRYGALISIVTLGLLTLLFVVDRRKQRLNKSHS